MSRKDRRSRERATEPMFPPAATPPVTPAPSSGVPAVEPKQAAPARRQLGHFVRHTYVNGELRS